jgi:predicted DNA-binding transcriptional regulator AlpA
VTASDQPGRSDEVKPRPARRPLALALTIVAAIIAACLIEEAAMRLLGLGKPQFYTYSSSRGWKLKPGASGWQSDEGRAWISINRWGYRGSQWTLTKPPHTLRIAVIGDSFTEAQQAPDDKTFEAVAQRLLNQRINLFARGRYAWVRDVQVMNFGIDGYGTAQELLTLERSAWRFSPDMVVLAFFAGNDVRNNSLTLEGDKCRPFYVERSGRYLLGGPFEDSETFRFQCFARFESRRSQLLNALGSARSVIRDHIKAWERREGWMPAATRVRAARHGPHSHHEPGINDLIYRPPINQTWTDAWNVSEAEIRMVRDDAARHHAAFLLAAINTGMQVYPNPLTRARYLESIGGTSLFYPDMRLRALGDREGFPVVTIAPAMQYTADADHVFFHGFPNTRPGIGHWNERGHCFGGSMIAEAIIATLSGKPAPGLFGADALRPAPAPALFGIDPAACAVSGLPVGAGEPAHSAWPTAPTPPAALSSRSSGSRTINPTTPEMPANAAAQR